MEGNMKQMAEDIGHCGNIASSAIVLATERSVDIQVPVAITLIMLKKLCEKNIEAQMDVSLPPEIQQLASAIGKDVGDLQAEAIKGMESMIDDYFEWQQLKKVEIKR